MSNAFGVNFSCSQCNKSMSNCQCNVPKSHNLTSGNSSVYGMCASCGQLLNFCQCPTVYKSAGKCSGCGNSPGFCCCAPFISPPVNPAIMPSNVPYITSSTQYNSETYDCRIFDIITKEKLDSCGRFVTEGEDHKIHGLYGKLSSFELPMEFECCFYHLRNDYKNLWQMRTPLTFRINIERDGKKEVKFFALVDFIELKNYEDRLVVHDAEFQEIKDNLEVTRLVEIQRIFTKLLRRI